MNFKNKFVYTDQISKPQKSIETTYIHVYVYICKTYIYICIYM